MTPLDKSTGRVNILSKKIVKTWPADNCDKKEGNDKLVGSAVGEADNDGRRTPLGRSTLLKTENETNDDTSGQ